MSEQVDVVVAGGGPAGAVVALTVARAGHRVLLTERKRSRLKIGEALPGAVRPLLRELALWDAFVRDGHLPSYGNRAAWGSSAMVDADFIHDPHGHGWHVDRGRLERFLRCAASAAGAEVVEGVDVRARVRVRARFVVDATGRSAAVARRFGARCHRDDRLVAVYGALRAGAGDSDARTVVEATPDGWWYTALVPGARRMAAFLTDADLLPRSVLTADGFLAALAATAHIGPRFATRLESGPFTAPAHGSWLDPPCGDGWLAVGDAALAFDPLSSQGMLTALFGGLAAGRAIDAWLGGDAGAMHAYRERVAAIRAAYERNCDEAYRLEPRWAERPFWARRRSAGGAVRRPGSESDQAARQSISAPITNAS